MRKNPTKQEKAVFQKFEEKVESLLEENGFSFDGYYWEKLTKSFGNIRVSLHKNSDYRTNGEYLFNIFCRFDGPVLAQKAFNCNPFSGKYNFHVSGADLEETVKEIVENCFEIFLYELDFDM